MTAHVEIVPYAKRWAVEFREIADELRAALGELAIRVDHIGSTSVPGLVAKDVIDVQVAVVELDPQLESRFEAVGYARGAGSVHDHVPAGADEDEEGWAKLFFFRRAPRRIHVHVRVDGAPNTRYALLFRDYLREYPRAAAAYGQLKLKLSVLRLESDVYADVKDPVCDLVIAAAEDWAARVGPRP